jgi:PAS domain S-box-containing protein
MPASADVPKPQALRDSEERLRLALQAAGGGAWDWRMTQDVAEVSESYRELFGLPLPTPVTYDVWLSCIHPDDRQRCREYGEAFFAGSETEWRLQFRIVTPHKGVRWHRAVGKVYRGADGEPLRFIGVSTDITDEHRAVASLQESEERFRAMADGLPLIIWVHDAEGAQQFVNRTFLEFFGVSEEEMKGGRWQALMHPDEGDRYARDFMACVRERRPFHSEVRVRAADGKWRNIESWARPRWSADGEFLGMVGASADVTERKRIERSLREADRRKDEFLAMLGHELRNPLAVVAMAMDTLKLQLPPASPAHHTREAVQRQTRILIRLVDDLLDSARISTGKIALQRTQLTVHQVVHTAIETSRPDLQARGHQLVVEEMGSELSVDGDEVRLVQVFTNVLNNAARYTPPGGRIRVLLEREAAQAVVRVQDSGIGIDPHKLDSVFEMFVQGDERAGERGVGLGLGLSLVKRVVELHGGSVKATSEGAGKGTEIAIRLPLSDLGPARPEGESWRPPQHGNTQRVLVIDDNPDGRHALAQLVETLGHEVRTAPDGATGVEAAGQFQPNIVFLDIGLPDMDGYAAAKLIRGLPNIGKPTIIAASGYRPETDALRDAGIDEYLVKPLTLQQIQALLLDPLH